VYPDSCKQLPDPPRWDREFYKTGYEGFECSERFPSAEDLDAYRRLLLDKTRHQVEFIGRHLGPSSLRVLELGAGNGRLLVGLALAQMLSKGVGIEIAGSRVAFACRWLEELHLSAVQCVQGDALDFRAYPTGPFDLAVCITGAFNYFRAIDETAPLAVLRNAYDVLQPGGSLLLELYNLPEKRAQMLAMNDGRLRLWQTLPPADRFAYYLDDFTYWVESRMLRHEKIFIGRDGTIDAGRVEILRYYSVSELADTLLVPAGFVDIQAFADFQGAPYSASQSSSLVVLARKPKVKG
jgi:SAM-dependent methyltransferase